MRLADRVVVVIGTSTSGIAEGEDAIEALHREASCSWHFTIGSKRSACYGVCGVLFGLRRIALHRLYGVLVVGERVRFCAALARGAGRCDAAVVGGADSSCRLTLNGLMRSSSFRQCSAIPSASIARG